MKAISTITAVLMGLAVLPDAAAAGGRAASPVRVLVPGGGAAAASGPVATFRAAGGTGVEVFATGPTEVTDGTTEAYTFALFNGSGTPLPAPVMFFEVFGLEVVAFIAGGWACSHDGTIGTCAWPTDLDPGEATDAVDIFVEVTGPYGNANTCNGERSPCAWFQAQYELDAQRVNAGVVVNGNHPPIAGEDDYLTGTPPAPVVAAVLDNDSDADSDPLELSIVIPPSEGTASIDPATREIIYTPGPTFPGSDEFWYRIADPFGATDTARVRITTGAGAISFDRQLIDIGPVEVGRYAASLAVLQNTTGFALIGNAFISAVPVDEVAGLLQGTGYDPALVVFDPTLCRPRTGDGYGGPNTSFAVIATCRAPAPLGTVPLLRLTMRMSPVGSPGVILEATTHVVLRSATAAEVPIHVNDDAATVLPDQPAVLHPLANDHAGPGAVLSVTGLAIADPVDFSPPSVEGIIDFADGQGPGGGIPYFGVLYTPPTGYTGTTSFYYAASEIVDGSWSRFDYAVFTVTVGATAPPVAVASGSATICEGGSAPLSGSGGVSCAWTPAIGLSDPASCTPTASPAFTTTYSLTVTDQQGQQSTNSATVTITVEAPPVALASGSTTIPVGASAALSGTGGASCAWSPAAGLNDPASCTPIASPSSTTTYALVVTSAAGCSSTNPASATVTVVQPPVAAASGSAAVCAGGSAPLSGSGGVSCAWSPAAGLDNATSCTPVASPSATTTYSLTVTDAYGQTSSNAATATITVNPLPVAVAGGTATITLGQSAPLLGSGGVSCAWSPAAGLNDAASCAPIASPTTTTTYSLAVTSAAGCVSVNPASATITVVPPSGGADLVVAAVLAPNQARQGEAIDIQAVTVNAGTGVAGASQTRVYLSLDQSLDASDQLLATASVPSLAAGQLNLSPVLTVAAPAVAPGQYYLIAAADDGHVIAETNETNNTQSSRIHIKRR